MGMSRNCGLLVVLCAIGGTLALTGCATSSKSSLAEAARPQLFLSLPDSCNVPDGMTLDSEGNIILACPNFQDKSYPAVLMKIDPANNLSKFYEFPGTADMERIGTMGLDFGPDGNLYIADNQYFWAKDHKSRLIRVVIKDGKAVSSEVAIDGFKLANAVYWKGNEVYVSDTFFDLPDKPGMSGVYRFTLDELNKGTIQLKPNATDPHLIATFTTVANHRGDLAGADGLTFDSKGNMYCGNYGDGVVSKITFDKDGNVASNEILIKDPRMPCSDGMFCDLKTDKIYVTDSENNAVHIITPDGELSTLWQNDDSDGSDGLLDQPCEPIIRGDELLIVCFDMPFPGLKNSKADEHHTISVIKLDR